MATLHAVNVLTDAIEGIIANKNSTPAQKRQWLSDAVVGSSITNAEKNSFVNGVIVPGIQSNEDPNLTISKFLTGYNAWLDTLPDVETNSTFLKDAAKAAGKILTAPITIAAKTGEFLADQAKSIPVVGKPLASVVRLTQGPIQLANSIARGENIKDSVVTNFKTAVADARTIGPYVQAVVGLVPGFGTAVSGVIGMGLAAGAVVAQGMPIDEALKEGVVGALPGGALVRLAAHTSIAIAEGKNVVDAAVSGVSKTVGGVGQVAINVAYKAAKGGNIVASSIEEAAKQLPPEGQAAIDLAQRIARGENVPAATVKSINDKLSPELKQAVKSIMGTVPISDLEKRLPEEVRTVLSYAKRMGAGEKIAPEILKAASDRLSPEMRNAVAIGLSVGSGSAIQDQLRKGIQSATNEDLNAIAAAGRELIKTVNLYKYGATIVPEAQKSGYELGVGVISKAGANEEFLALYRNKLRKKSIFALTSVPDLEAQKGFDFALAITIGKAEVPLPPKELEAQAQAAYYASKGVKRATIPIKTAVVETLIAKPVTKVGLDYVVNQNKSLWHKVLVLLGYAK